jgi:hypothetical protein
MNETAFPYPVLGNGQDYTDSAFQAVLDVELEDTEDGQQVSVNYFFNLSNKEISENIWSDKAAFALEIECSDSFYREVLLVEQEGKRTLPLGELFGRLIIRPIVVAIKPIKRLASTDFNPEYEGQSFSIDPGDMLAIDEEVFRNLDFIHLNFESMLKITTSCDLDEYEYGFDPNDDVLTINMGTKFRELWNENHLQKDKAPFLAMAVYKDCLVAALEALAKSGDSDDIGQYRWARALGTKLAELEIRIPQDADFDQFNKIAQALVKDLGVKRIIRND